MLVTASENHTLDTLLELLCINLQLTETQDQRARAHYGAVSRWLAADGSPLGKFSPHIYPQGSQRLGTTTRPVGRDEFDLDAVCKLSSDQSLSPGDLYELIWDRLKEHGTYRPMMRRLPRCIRLDYAGDFHLDIAPAIPDPEYGGNFILVPDRSADLSGPDAQNDRWKSTNPVDFAVWFEDQCVPVLVLHEKCARAQVDPVPDSEPVHRKPALKRSVQLFKRWRDVEYAQRGRLAPPSIILTTLSGHLYRSEQLCSDALRSILNATAREIAATDRLCLTNPAHPEENICEKWDNTPGAYDDFATALVRFRDRWERLLATRGIHHIEEELAELFGESPVQAAIRAFMDNRVIAPRSRGALGVRTGATPAMAAAVAAPAIAVPTNTFFGD